MHLIVASFFGARRSYVGFPADFTRLDNAVEPGTTLFLKNVRTVVHVSCIK